MQHRVTLHRPVPPDLRGEFRDKLAYCYERLEAYELTDDGTAVLLTLGSESDLSDAAARILTLARALLDRHRPVESVVTFENRVTPPYGAPVWDELVKARLVHSEGPGQITLSGAAARVIEGLDRIFHRMATEHLGAEEQHYPTMLSIAAMDRCHYFGSFPQHVTFAPHVREDLEVITDVARSTPEAADRFGPSLAPPTHMMSPTVCYHTYLYFADRVLDRPATITARGRCFRYEGKNFTTLERLWDFDMREVVFLGPNEWVEERRQACVDATIAIVRQLGLDAWIETANDPFFVNNFVAQRYFQRMSMTKLELRLSIPSTGTSLAAGSFNLHADFMGRSFGIADAAGPAFTGCVGFGYERWVWAMFSQFGPELRAWPDGVRSLLQLT